VGEIDPAVAKVVADCVLKGGFPCSLITAIGRLHSSPLYTAFFTFVVDKNKLLSIQKISSEEEMVLEKIVR